MFLYVSISCILPFIYPYQTSIHHPSRLLYRAFLLQSRNKALSGVSSSPRSRTRRPPPPARLQRLDATTYRPHKHLLAGPPATPQPDEEEGEGEAHAHHRRDYTPTSPKQQVIPNPSTDNFEIQRSEEIEHHLNQNEDHFRSLGQEPNIFQNLNAQNYQQQYQLSRVPSTDELLRQQQLYEQQRRALELELQRYHVVHQSPDPLHYRLLPQTENRGIRHHDHDLDPIQKSRLQ